MADGNRRLSIAPGIWARGHHVHDRRDIVFGGRRADGRVTEFTCVRHEGEQGGPI